VPVEDFGDLRPYADELIFLRDFHEMVTKHGGRDAMPFVPPADPDEQPGRTAAEDFA
jgi:hypothetical protein